MNAKSLGSCECEDVRRTKKLKLVSDDPIGARRNVDSASMKGFREEIRKSSTRSWIPKKVFYNQSKHFSAGIDAATLTGS